MNHQCPNCGYINPLGDHTPDRELSHEEFIARLNPPMKYIKPKNKALRTLIQALHDPLSKLLKSPFRRKKEKP